MRKRTNEILLTKLMKYVIVIITLFFIQPSGQTVQNKISTQYQITRQLEPFCVSQCRCLLHCRCDMSMHACLSACVRARACVRRPM